MPPKGSKKQSALQQEPPPPPPSTRSPSSRRVSSVSTTHTNTSPLAESPEDVLLTGAKSGSTERAHTVSLSRARSTTPQIGEEPSGNAIGRVNRSLSTERPEPSVARLTPLSGIALLVLVIVLLLPVLQRMPGSTGTRGEDGGPAGPGCACLQRARPASPLTDQLPLVASIPPYAKGYNATCQGRPCSARTLKSYIGDVLSDMEAQCVVWIWLEEAALRSVDTFAAAVREVLSSPACGAVVAFDTTAVGDPAVVGSIKGVLEVGKLLGRPIRSPTHPTAVLQLVLAGELHHNDRIKSMLLTLEIPT